MFALQLAPARAAPAAGQADPAAHAGSAQRKGRGKGKAASGRRLYELVVSVMAGPPDSAFRFTKASTIHQPDVIFSSVELLP